MGSQKIGRNEPCHCGSGKKYKVCCYLTERDKVITKGLDSISDDSYFIRLKDDIESYLHLEEDNKDNYVYKVKKGTIGACGWHKKEGERFINESGRTNLELVNMKDVIRKENN